MAEVNGTSQVIRNLSNYARNVTREIVWGCEAVQAKVVEQSQAVVPVVTGKLQGSIKPAGITIQNDNVEAIIAANANYASYVEFGTSRQRAQPYLVPALHQNMPVFRNAMRAAVARARAA